MFPIRDQGKAAWKYGSGAQIMNVTRTTWGDLSEQEAGPLHRQSQLRITVVIPCYKVRAHILSLVERIGSEVTQVFVVDDACPESTGEYVVKHCEDERVVVVTHEQNQGVGGAVMTGYRLAVLAGVDVVVKLDGDGQMDPALIPQFVLPIVEQRADYVKGNRFYNIEDVRVMPKRRLIGNAVLSFVTKLSSGYWTIFDPTNGYTAISAKLLPFLPLGRIHPRYFFESDMLFRLGTIRAAVVDIPMTAIYGDEQSGLRVRRVLLPFIWGNAANMGKRIFYSYFLRGFSIASIELLAGISLMLFGIVFGTWNWVASARAGLPATTGTVMLAALPVILGVQLLLQFLAFDIGSVPTRSVAPLLPRRHIGTEGAPVIRSKFRCGQPVLVETADGEVAPNSGFDMDRGEAKSGG